MRPSIRLQARIVLQSALQIRSTLTLQLRGNFLKLTVRQGDFSKNCGNRVARDFFEIMRQRHDKYSTQIDRCRTHSQLARVKDLWPMFSSREQVRDPLPSLVKDRDVDQRLRSFAGGFREQVDGAIHSIDQSRSIPPEE